MSDFSLNVKINGVEQAVTTVGELELALKATREELRNVELGSQAFDELSLQGRKLQDNLKDVKESLNFDKNLSLLGESVGRLGSTIASSFTIALSAASLFGEESEDLTKAQVKAQQLLAIAFSATTLAANAAKFAGDAKNVTDKLSIGLTSLLTSAIGKETIAKSAQAAATGTATVAQRALNVVMAANPVLLLVGAIGALVGAYALLGDETEKTYKAQVDFNEELDRNTKAITDNISKQKELAKLQGQIRELGVKSESERLKIRSETEKALGELDQVSLDERKKNIQDKIDEEKKALDISLVFVKTQIDNEKALQDFNANGFLTKAQQEEAALIRSQQFLKEEERFNVDFYAKLFEIRMKWSDFETEEDAKAFSEKRKAFLELINQQKGLNKEQEVLNASRELDEKKTADEIAKANLESYKKRKEAAEEYNRSLKKLNEDRVKDEININRKIEDFLNERISLNEQGNEDLIKSYDETIAKIETSRDRTLEDARISFEKEVEDFREAQIKKGIAVKKVDEDIAKLREQFRLDQKAREVSFNLEIEKIEEDKTKKIAEINQILESELTFGDNSLSDSKKRIALDYINFEIGLLDQQIEMNRGYNEELIRQRQELYKEQLKLAQQAQLEQLTIEYQEAIKNVQGTEEQKGEQRKRLTDKYNKDVQNINRQYLQNEKDLVIKNEEEIWAYRKKKLDEWNQLLSQFTSQALGLASAITEMNRVEIDNQLMDLRDSSNQQVSILNEQYNTNLANLQSQYDQGLLTQEQYNNAVNNLNSNLSESTKKIQKKQRDEENKLKKKAFEEDKRLKIAQTIISGIQGALTAFTSAFQLGPIAGPIVGGILAGLVAATTAVQVAAISKTRFDAGPQEITTPNTGGGGSLGGGGGTGTNTLPSGSGGGFTQFNESLVGSPTGGGQSGSGDPGVVKVVVLESDITNTQKRVQVAESTSSFG